MNGIKLTKNWLLNRTETEPTAGPATILALVTGETEKTIQINYNDRIAWLQKSLVKINPCNNNQVTLTIPFWLFTRKFPGPKK